MTSDESELIYSSDHPSEPMLVRILDEDRVSELSITGLRSLGGQFLSRLTEADRPGRLRRRRFEVMHGAFPAPCDFNLHHPQELQTIREQLERESVSGV